MLRTLQHPIKLLLNPDHVLFELGVFFVELLAGDVVARHAKLDAVEAAVDGGDPAVERLNNAVASAQHRDTGCYRRL